MSKTIQAVRGMKDILPAETPLWRRVEDAARAVIEAYGYREIRLPIVESTGLFERAIGDASDIVEKEMYTFADRNGDSLTLRPEGTAGCVRAGIEHGLLHNQIQRLWYLGPMFRHEKPQKGRYRQFHQIGVEAFGMNGPDVDAELILMTARLWRVLGVGRLRLEINSLGTPESRASYREELRRYFGAHRDRLDEDSVRRLDRNPLRILDSKNPDMKTLIAGAPPLSSALDTASREHFERLQALLRAGGVEFVHNPRLVRGLDYYTRTVFEWITEDLGAQGTICAGGRYDELVAQFGGQPAPAVGFALGIERLVALLAAQGEAPSCAADIFVIAVGDAALGAAVALTESLRDAGTHRIELACGGGGFKSQFKRADRSGAALALVLGEDEARAGTATVKFLRRDLPQRIVGWADLAAALPDLLMQARA
ncbi:MAG: histidine--tRNA ligase [Gammaproteobacteria bacterium]